MSLIPTQSKSDSTIDPDANKQKSGLFSRLSRSRQALQNGLNHLFRGREQLNEADYEALEEQLLLTDMGIEISMMLVERVREAKTADLAVVTRILRHSCEEILLSKDPEQPAITVPRIIMMVGVNGVGKTTTTAKLASFHINKGRKVMLAAADTFRAAAIDQLQNWGERLQIPVIAQQHGADAAAVAHDAYSAAKARGMDILIIDTAGRQHVQSDLMDQLQKICRVLTKLDTSAPHETLLVIDANNGQNAISQLQRFNEAVGVSGLCLTKLDGTARGGIILALAHRFAIPIRFVGIGEGIDDLQTFNAHDFVNALIPHTPTF